MKRKLILHVLHSSDSIPIRDGFLVDFYATSKIADNLRLLKKNLKMAEKLT